MCTLLDHFLTLETTVFGKCFILILWMRKLKSRHVNITPCLYRYSETELLFRPILSKPKPVFAPPYKLPPSTE